MQELINEYRGALQETKDLKANLQTKIDAKKRPPLFAGKKEIFKRCQRKQSYQN